MKKIFFSLVFLSLSGCVSGFSGSTHTTSDAKQSDHPESNLESFREYENGVDELRDEFLISKTNSTHSYYALQHMKKSANLGNSKAELVLAEMYRLGLGQTEPNYKEAIVWFTKSANKNNVPAKHRLALMYINGYGVEKNISYAETLLLEAANENYSPAMVDLGKLYLSAKDKRQSVQYFEKAAKLNNSDGIFHYATALADKDLKNGLEMQMKAAIMGNLLAQCYLASYFDKNNDKTANHKLAYLWGNACLRSQNAMPDYYRKFYPDTANKEFFVQLSNEIIATSKVKMSKNDILEMNDFLKNIPDYRKDNDLFNLLNITRYN